MIFIRFPRKIDKLHVPKPFSNASLRIEKINRSIIDQNFVSIVHYGIRSVSVKIRIRPKKYARSKPFVWITNFENISEYGLKFSTHLYKFLSSKKLFSKIILYF